MRAYCVSVSSIQQRYHEPPNSVNRPYYDSVSVETTSDGLAIVLESNTLGHIHGPNTEEATHCTVSDTSAVVDAVDFAFHFVSRRTPQPMPSFTVSPGANSAHVTIDVEGYVAVSWRAGTGGRVETRVAHGVTPGATLMIPDLQPETPYRVRARRMTLESFDLYRAGRTGPAQTLIATTSPPLRWSNNLAGGGVGKPYEVAFTTAPSTDVPEEEEHDDEDEPIPVSTLPPLGVAALGGLLTVLATFAFRAACESPGPCRNTMGARRDCKRSNS